LFFFCGGGGGVTPTVRLIFAGALYFTLDYCGHEKIITTKTSVM